jgi:hypothetical protein
LRKEVETVGLTVDEFLGDVAGADYDPVSSEFAVIAKKSEAGPSQ